MYIGAVGPETKVYASNEVPKRFLDKVQSLGIARRRFSSTAPSP